MLYFHGDFFLKINLKSFSFVSLSHFIVWIRFRFSRIDKVKDELCRLLNKVYETDYYEETNFIAHIQTKLPPYYTNVLTDELFITYFYYSYGAIRYNKSTMLQLYDLKLKRIKKLSHYMNTINLYGFSDENWIMTHSRGKIDNLFCTLTIQKDVDEYSDISDSVYYFELNNQFEFIKIRKKITGYNELDTFIEHDRGLSVDDELELIALKTRTFNKEFYDMLPEINIPSAYDFNSDDFNNRLILVKMIEY